FDSSLKPCITEATCMRHAHVALELPLAFALFEREISEFGAAGAKHLEHHACLRLFGHLERFCWVAFGSEKRGEALERREPSFQKTLALLLAARSVAPKLLDQIHGLGIGFASGALISQRLENFAFNDASPH